MAKRVFKNKHLVRNLLILAVLLFIGFFLWTMLFKRGSIFEGQTVNRDVDPFPPSGFQSIGSINDQVKAIIALPIDEGNEEEQSKR